jgi:hypothetical protein
LGFFWHERVEYNVFLFDEPLKDSKSLKIFKISVTFTQEKILKFSVSNKKIFFSIIDSKN